VSTPAGASTPRARRAVDGVVAAIDVVSTVAGWFAGWLVVPLAVAVAYEDRRPVRVQRPDPLGQHRHLPALWVPIHARGAVHAAPGQAHPHRRVLRPLVRLDRAIVDAVSYVLFFFPAMVLIFYVGTVEVWHAREIGERVGGGRLIR
jgi:hypothetical protein